MEHSTILAKNEEIATLRYLHLKSQMLLLQSINAGLYEESQALEKINQHLAFVLGRKRSGNSTHYIWRTQEDGNVRSSHRENNGKIFSWDSPPPTGHPGEDFNCRCWAEPLGDTQYADQLLISEVNDNPVKWTTKDFIDHYILGGGKSITLQEVGYLSDVIGHYSQTLGIYDAVNQQIIEEALAVGEDSFIYDFGRSYEFNKVLFVLGDATVKGIFVGDARKEQDFLVINGIITYDFFDIFSDPFTFIEIINRIPGISREDATNLIGELVDFSGDPFFIEDRWQTKFNAAVKIDDSK